MGTVYAAGDEWSRRIVDFGLARQSRRPERAPDLLEDPAESALITEVGSVLGTPGYMAPERAHGREVDARAIPWIRCSIALSYAVWRRTRTRFADAGDLLHHLPRDPAPSIRG